MDEWGLYIRGTNTLARTMARACCDINMDLRAVLLLLEGREEEDKLPIPGKTETVLVRVRVHHANASFRLAHSCRNMSISIFCLATQL